MSGFRDKFIALSSSAAQPKRSPTKFVVADKPETIFTPPSQRECSSPEARRGDVRAGEQSPKRFKFVLGNASAPATLADQGGEDLVLEEEGLEDDGVTFRKRVAVPANLAGKLRSYQGEEKEKKKKKKREELL